MRVGDVDIALFQRPLRAQMTHDEFLKSYEGMASQLEIEADAAMVGPRPRDLRHLRKDAKTIRAKVSAVRGDPTAVRDLAAALHVRLSENTSAEPGVVHSINVFATTAALLTRQPVHTLCGTRLPDTSAPKDAPPCSRCARN